MRFNVSQQLKAPVGVVRAYDIDGRLGNELVTGRATFTRTAAGILVQAECQTKAVWTCGRCAGPYTQLMTLEIEEEFIPAYDMVSRARVEIDEETYRIDASHTLDLAEAVQEGALLASPIKPLCRSNCAGLCPVCGANLNEATCTCAARSGHAALAELGRRWTERQAI